MSEQLSAYEYEILTLVITKVNTAKEVINSQDFERAAVNSAIAHDTQGRKQIGGLLHRLADDIVKSEDRGDIAARMVAALGFVLALEARITHAENANKLAVQE